MISETLGRLGDAYGERTRRRLEELYPLGIKGRMGEIYMTRAKRRGRTRSTNFKGYRSAAVIKDELPDTYEVVHEVLFYVKTFAHRGRESMGRFWEPKQGFVLSLFPHQIQYTVQRDRNIVEHGIDVRIKFQKDKAGCVRHILHWLWIKHSSTEIYLKEIEETKE